VVDPGSNVLSKADHGPAQLCEKPMGDRHHSPPPHEVGLSDGGAQQVAFREEPIGGQHRSTQQELGLPA
jgi:hypothetical protein